MVEYSWSIDEDIIEVFSNFIESFPKMNREKRHRCYLNRTEEAQFLASFLEEASAGQICVAGRLNQALEDHLGHGVHHSTVYRMLDRNQWRRVVPRPVHPEAREQAQEDFKKNSPNW